MPSRRRGRARVSRTSCGPACRPVGRLDHVQGIREVPAVPMAAVAALLVVVLGASVLVYSGVGRGGGGATSASLNRERGVPPRESVAQPPSLSSPGAFGQLPSPRFTATPTNASAPGVAQPASPAADYAGQVALTWTGKLDLTISSAPVFRYHEPSTNTADQFATALGAVLVSRIGLRCWSTARGSETPARS